MEQQPPQPSFDQTSPPQFDQQPISQPPFNQQPMSPPPFNQQPPMPQENPGKVLGIVGLVMGILGVLLACSLIFFFLGLPLAIGALGCGIMGKNRTPAGMSSGMAIAAIVLGIVSFVVVIVMLTLWLLVFATTGAELGTTNMGEIFHYLFLTY